MAKTLVQLAGEELDLNALQAVLRTGNWRIMKEMDSYYLTSAVLDALTHVSEVKAKSKQFMDNLNGAATLFFGNHRQVTIGAVVRVDNDGKRSIFLSVDEPIRIRSRMSGELHAKGEILPKPSMIEQLIEKAETHSAVSDALHMWNEPTWQNLYKIYEIIKDDIGDKKKFEKLVDKKKFGVFTQAAQSRDYLGDKARHASKKYRPPATSISDGEAVALIRDLFDKWVALK